MACTSRSAAVEDHLVRRRSTVAAAASRVTACRWLPVLADTPIGFAGMFYLGVDDFDAVHDRIAARAQIVKDSETDHTGQRMFYFQDPDGYIVGINDKKTPPSAPRRSAA